ADFHAGVAPGSGAARRVAGPHLADAQAAHVGRLAVHAQRLAVIAADPAERAVQAGRIEGAHLDAALPQPLPVAARGGAQAAQPVVQHAYSRAVPCRLDERIGELAAHRVVV